MKKKCRCGEIYYQYTTLQNKCIKCLSEKTKKNREQKERKAHRCAVHKLKTRSQHLKETQSVFNQWIRLINEEEPCMSCRSYTKNNYHAGHYRSVGSSPELRFEPLNVWKQCAKCNTYFSGNAIEYRINLVKEIGVEKVEWLEGPHEPLNLTIQDIIDIKLKYRKLIKNIRTEINLE